MNLKQITKKDQDDLMKVYFDSIISIDENIYSKDQKRAWASQAWDNKTFSLSIKKGKQLLLLLDIQIIEFLFFIAKGTHREKVMDQCCFIK